MSRCEKYIEMAGLYLDGELGESDREELFAHLEACGECRSYFEVMKFASGALEVTAAPEGFAKSVMDAVGAASQGAAVPAAGKRKRNIRRAAAKIAALAACLALVAAAGAKVVSGQAAPAAAGEGSPAAFGCTGSGYDAEADGNAIEDRDADYYISAAAEEAGEAEERPSSSNCAANIEAVTVTHGGVVTHTADRTGIVELTELLKYASGLDEVPSGDADYVLDIDCAGSSRTLYVWERDGELLCSVNGESGWTAAGGAEELESWLRG